MTPHTYRRIVTFRYAKGDRVTWREDAGAVQVVVLRRWTEHPRGAPVTEYLLQREGDAAHQAYWGRENDLSPAAGRG